MMRASVTLPRLTMPPPRVEPLTVLVDTREQTPPPWPKGVLVERATLGTGDYSCPRLRDRVAIERKAPGDFMSSLTHDRERFDREMDRASDLDAFAIVVEASLDECLALTRADWRGIVGSIASFAARGIGCYFMGSPVAAGRLICGILSRWEAHLLPKVTPAEMLRDAADRLELGRHWQTTPAMREWTRRYRLPALAERAKGAGLHDAWEEWRSS